MIVRSLGEIEGTARDVEWGNGLSRRFLVAAENMGFSLTDTIIRAGSTSTLEYRNHLEACYCIAGEGEIRDVRSGKSYPIVPGTMYALDRHDAHDLIARTEMRLVCVFSPALRGDESHNLNGGAASSY